MDTAKIPATAAVITRNSGKSIERCLHSMRNFSEIIVCDGNSTDDTVEIAKRFGARVISQDPQFLYEDGRIKDFAGVRNQTLSAASHEWYFFLDSDEYCEDDLIEEMRGIVAANVSGAYFVPRLYVIDGKIIRCASTYPNFQMRFFSKKSVRAFIKTVHERIEVLPGVEARRLFRPTLIPMEVNIAQIRAKWDYYTKIHVEREGAITLREYLWMCYRSAGISALFFYRFCRNLLFCSGPRMPFAVEMERHRYHLRALRAFAGSIRGF